MTLFRSFDEKNDMDNDGDESNELNKWTDSNHDAKTQIEHSPSIAKSVNDDEKLLEAKLAQLKINKCEQILREIFFNGIFICVLLVITYFNRNLNSFNYQKQVKTSFSGYQQVCID